MRDTHSAMLYAHSRPLSDLDSFPATAAEVQSPPLIVKQLVGQNKRPAYIAHKTYATTGA